jgi:hypothetical protein
LGPRSTFRSPVPIIVWSDGALRSKVTGTRDPALKAIGVLAPIVPFLEKDPSIESRVSTTSKDGETMAEHDQVIRELNQKIWSLSELLADLILKNQQLREKLHRLDRMADEPGVARN